MIRTGSVRTNENCVGCNKCIGTCSCMGAMVARQDESGRNVIEVDDTEEFFRALESGEKISLLIAPAFLANYPKEYESVLGGLKAMGVNRMVSISFGADITPGLI